MGKVCTKCNIEKPLEDFYVRKDREEVRTVCRACTQLYKKEYKQRTRKIEEPKLFKDHIKDKNLKLYNKLYGNKIAVEN